MAEQEWTRVETRKGRIAAQAELNATLAANRMTDELQGRKRIPLNVLVPVFGVNVDKATVLRGDSLLTIRHEHTHRLTDDDIIAFAVAHSKKRKAIDAEFVTDASIDGHADTRQLAEKTQRKRDPQP